MKIIYYLYIQTTKFCEYYGCHYNTCHNTDKCRERILLEKAPIPLGAREYMCDFETCRNSACAFSQLCRFSL